MALRSGLGIAMEIFLRAKKLERKARRQLAKLAAGTP